MSEQNTRDTAGLSRRGLMGCALALSALGTLPAQAAAQKSATAKRQQPRLRVIMDNDFEGDPDGLFALAQLLLSPSVEIPLIIGSHLHAKDGFDPTPGQAEDAVKAVRQLYAEMHLQRTPPVIAGRNRAGFDKKAAPSAAAKRIIAEARRTDTRLPLYYAAGAGLTDLAEALLRAPDIAKKLTLIWIGGREHNDLLPGVPARTDQEYNQTIDNDAVRTIFNKTEIPIWQVPRNVYRQMMISYAELKLRLRPAGRLGSYLLGRIDRIRAFAPDRFGETYILGDSPLVTLTALQSSFEPDSSSCAYVVQPTGHMHQDGSYTPNPKGRPMRIYTSIDTRLTFGDMFAKFTFAND